MSSLYDRAMADMTQHCCGNVSLLFRARRWSPVASCTPWNQLNDLSAYLEKKKSVSAPSRYLVSVFSAENLHSIPVQRRQWGTGWNEKVGWEGVR